MSEIVEKLYPIITEKRKEKFVISINAPWGYGKTYIAGELIKRTQNESNKYNPVLPVLIDLSDYNYINDPFIPFIVEVLDAIDTATFIQKEIKEMFITIMKRGAFPLAMLLAETKLTGGLLKFSGLIKELGNIIPKIFSRNKKVSQLETNIFELQSYSSKLNDLSTKINTICKTTLQIDDKDYKIERVVVFIDNFDRVECQFIFKFLNLIDKINSEHITFCLLMNRKQLEENIYSHILSRPVDNSEHFLDKYVDFEYCLPQLFDRVDDISSNILDIQFIQHIRNDRTLTDGLSIRQLIKIKRFYTDYTNEFGSNGELKTIFLLTCFLEVNKSSLISMYYNFIPSFEVSVNGLSGKILAKIYLESFSQTNLTPNYDKPYYLITNDIFKLNAKVNILFKSMIKFLLKEDIKEEDL